MKKDLKQKIKDMTQAQLLKRVEEINKEVLTNKMKLSLGSLKNVHANKPLKKERAYIKFILSQKAEEDQKPQSKKTK